MKSMPSTSKPASKVTACHLKAYALTAGLNTAGVQNLKLGLSGVRTVALCLSHLTALGMNNCAEIQHLQLCCPSLLTAYFQACK